MERNWVLTTAGLSLGLMVTLSGCAQRTAVTQPPAAQPEAAVVAPAAQPEAIAQPAGTPPAAGAPVGLSGKVAEVITSGGYTYVRLEKDGKTTWAAMSTSAKVDVGQELDLVPGAVMTNFKSKSLNRTFDSIVFTDGPVGQTAANPHRMQAAPTSADATEKISGKVMETMESGGYTYINVEQPDGKQSWFAIPSVKVAVGQQVELLSGMAMDNFTSKTLNRTFDRIHFSPGLAPAAGASKGAAPAGHPHAAAPAQEAQAPAQQSGGHMAGSTGGMKPGRHDVVVSGKVVESMDAGGYTFMLLDQQGTREWAAVPTMKVEPGQELKLEPGTEMLNFTSKRLNRDFGKRVVFSPGPVKTK